MPNFRDTMAEAINQRLTEVNHATDNPLVWRVAKKASSAFTGGSANTHGDSAGTGNPYTLFTVTGDVVLKAIWGVVNVDLTGATWA